MPGFKRAYSKNNQLHQKEVIPLTDEENKSYKKQKECYIFKKGFNTDENDKNSFKLYHKVRDHC